MNISILDLENYLSKTIKIFSMYINTKVYEYTHTLKTFF